VSWARLAARPELARTFDHIVALDPPPGGVADSLLHVVPRAHLAWGPAEAEFTITAYRASLDLRPHLTEVYRALRALEPAAPAWELEAALCGTARYPREPAFCARLLTVLTELGLVQFDAETASCRILEGVKSDLELSPTYRAAHEELTKVEHALAPEFPRAVPAAATG
jgi:hypothetical protein